MDVLISKISRTENFTKTGRRNCLPLVVHCVPGAGKSTLIRELLDLDSRFVAFTFGVVDPITLTNRRITAPIPPEQAADKLLLIDEYLEGDFSDYNPIAIFGDPFQSSGNFPALEAHFINSTTHRFGVETCSLLRSFGFEIFSTRTDKVIIEGLFTSELDAVVIAVEEEVKDLLKAHSVQYHCLELARGATFDSTTVCVAENTIPEHLRAAYFVALTRHRHTLRILSPDATFSAS